MSIRKLVQLDDDGWCMDIDMVKLKRVAAEFRAWLMTVDPSNDLFGFLKQDLPLVDAALKGEMLLPYKGWEPHMRELGEGLLPGDYTRVSAPFYNTIRGADRSIETVTKDGKRYAWAEFEDSSDAAGA
jgi:hypothetical protein